MSQWSCMIVEDEPLAQNVLKQYIEQHPSLQLTAICDDAMEAQRQLNEHNIDILFLDVNLPGLSGIQLLRSLPHPPSVIFTSAYPEFAVEGFELDAVDYLVKPFSLERFLKAVNKAIAVPGKANTPAHGYIFVKADKKVFRVVIDDILDAEALGDYVKLRMSNTQHLINSTLRDLLEELPGNQFIRVHKSFAIALNKIEFVEGNYIRIAGKDIPIGATY
ncbi:MAG: LytR/AlgR family response regulator transcription factor, partial [Flavisolibacter sp.]